MKKILTTSGLALLSLLNFRPALAQVVNANTAQDFTNSVGSAAGFQPITIGYVIAILIQGALSVLALIFLILAILSGFRWMTAAGNEEKITQAQDTLRAAIIGLIVILAAWAITYFIFQNLPFSGGSMGTAVAG